jgi:hypothetical protein
MNFRKITLIFGAWLVLIQTFKSATRDVSDFPQKGIIFKNITHILFSSELFELAKSTRKEIAELLFSQREKTSNCSVTSLLTF